MTEFKDLPAKETPATGDEVMIWSDADQAEARAPMVIAPDLQRRAVERSSGGHLTVLYDDAGNPSIMRVIPRFRYEDLGYDGDLGTGTATAFIVGGVEKSEIFVGQFLASQMNNLAVSLPGVDPWASIDYDAALAACTGKGTGWHLMTMHEWAALALWCAANGFEPRGNTNWGRAHDATHETATRGDGEAPGVSSGTGRTNTGTGPHTWRHDGSPTGVADLTGNVWEWMHGMKLVDGEVYAIADNDYGLAEASWPSASRFLRNDINAGQPTLSMSGSANESYENVEWVNTPVESGYTESQLLRRLLIEPSPSVTLQGRLYSRDYGERFPRRGGGWGTGGNAGLAALGLNTARAYAHAPFGFRPAFVA